MSTTPHRIPDDAPDGRGAVASPAAPVSSPHRRSRALGRLRALLAVERGAATAEYAVATMAAVGFAGLLVVILRGEEVRGILTDLVRNALTVG
jgi:hypothetical protein